MRSRLLVAAGLFSGVVVVSAPVSAANPVTVTINVPAGIEEATGSLSCRGVVTLLNARGGPYTLTVQSAPTGTNSCDLALDLHTATDDHQISRAVTISGGVGSATFDFPTDTITVHTLPSGSYYDEVQYYEFTSIGDRIMPDGATAHIRTHTTGWPENGGDVQWLVAGPDGTFNPNLPRNQGNPGPGSIDLTGVTELTYVMGGDMYVGNATGNADADAIVDAEEAVAARSAQGDGNADGIADATQPNVLSFLTWGPDVTYAGPTGTVFAATSQQPVFPLPQQPSGWDLPLDSLIGFELRNVAPGGSATVSMHETNPHDYGGYAQWDGTSWSLLPVVVPTAHKSFAVTFTDGGSGDLDGQADGVITSLGQWMQFADVSPPSVYCDPFYFAWSRDNVATGCQAIDWHSGLPDGQPTLDFTLQTSLPADQESAMAPTDTKEVCDAAGNCTTVGPLYAMVDRHAPDITLVAPAGTYTLDEVATVAYSCADGASGVDDCQGDLNDGDAIDTSTLGTHQFRMFSADEAGNYRTQQFTYEVIASTNDNDGVSDATEDAGPNGGDGNHDGTPDSAQDNVTSLPGATGAYLTVAGPTGTNLIDVSAVDLSTLPAAPANYTLPDSLLSFTVGGVAPGGTTTVRVYTPSAASITGWAKFHDGSWSTLPAGNVDVNVADGRIDITLVDGGVGDDDGVANGQIVDPGGPVSTGDTAAPVINCGAAPSTWSRFNLVVSCSASDAGSGLAQSLDASFTLSTTVAAGTETANAVTTQRSVCDVAGNCATAVVSGFKIDRRAPSITLTSPTTANVAQGSALVASYSCADAGSGLGTCSGPVASGASISTSSPGTRTFTVTATDAAGNSASRSVTYRVVANVAPTVRADLGMSGLEDVGFQSRAVTVSGSFADPDGAGPYTASIRWSPTSSFSSLAVTGNGFSSSTTYPSAGSRVVTVRVCDAAGACGTDTITVRAAVTQKVKPVVQCVIDRGSRAKPRYVATLGYDNPASFAIVVPTVNGSENSFTSAPYTRGQPQIFKRGSQRNVFAVAFGSGTQTWRLNGVNASASTSTKRC